MLNCRWQSKPPPGTPIDPYGPFASGMIAAWAINEGTGPALYNAVNPSLYQGVFAATTQAPTWGGGSRGASIACVTAVQQYVDHGVVPLSGASKATMFAMGNRATSTIWSVGRATTTGARFFILAYNDNNVYFNSESDGTNTKGGSTTGGVNPAGDFSVAQVFDGSQSTIANGVTGYINGAAQTLSPYGTWSAPVTLFTNTDTWRTGNANSGFTTGRFDLSLLWVGRALSALEIASLHANPWQVFLPPSPYLLYHSRSSLLFRRTLTDRAGSRGVM
jgi:hypothetical protein